jgi:HlyD family secretion protein
MIRASSSLRSTPSCKRAGRRTSTRSAPSRRCARAEHELGAASEIGSKPEQTAPICREQAQAWQQLAKEGFAGRLLALERQRSSSEAEQELKAQGRNIESLRATITQADKRIAQLRSNYRQQLHNERVEAEAHTTSSSRNERSSSIATGCSS